MSIRTAVEIAGALVLATGWWLATLEVAALERKNTELTQAIEQQNAEIEAAKQEAARQAAVADAAALRVLHRTAVARQRITQAGSGPEEMNQWFSDTFLAR